MLTSGAEKAVGKREILDFSKNTLHSCSLCLRIAHGLVNRVVSIDFIDKISNSCEKTQTRK
jgi:hypothetical protein